jgi:hypothetical protein
MPETIATTATIKTIFISLFSLDMQAATPGKSWMFRALPQPHSFRDLRCSQDGVHGRFGSRPAVSFAGSKMKQPDNIFGNDDQRKKWEDSKCSA